jgi:hypothetical protein
MVWKLTSCIIWSYLTHRTPASWGTGDQLWTYQIKDILSLFEISWLVDIDCFESTEKHGSAYHGWYWSCWSYSILPSFCNISLISITPLILIILIAEWKESLWICVWIHSTGNRVSPFHINPHVSNWHQLYSNRQCLGILSITTCLNKCNWSPSFIRVNASFFSVLINVVELLDILWLLVNSLWSISNILVAISWCTYSASAIFVAVLQLMEMRALVAYPVGLFCKNPLIFNWL